MTQLYVEADLTDTLLHCPKTHDLKVQNRLIALFLLAIRPHLASSFPSFTFPYPQCNPNDQARFWRDRLQMAIQDVQDPSDLIQVLKWVSRRFSISSSTTRRTSKSSWIDAASYTQFAEAERANGFPLDAYGKLFRPQLESDITTYLDEVFTGFVIILTHSESNTITVHQLSVLFGWWVCGWDRDRNIMEWTEFHEMWVETGNRLEHLFYAWVR